MRIAIANSTSYLQVHIVHTKGAFTPWVSDIEQGPENQRLDKFARDNRKLGISAISVRPLFHEPT